MSFKTMADNNVPITANRDGALYNVALSNQSFIIKGMGSEYEPSVEGLVFSVGTGIAVLKGRHVTSDLVTEDNTLELPANSSGYVVIRLDLSRPIGTEAYLYATPTLTQQEINWNGIIYDLPIATFTSTLTNASIEDVRVIIDKASGGEITSDTKFNINGTEFEFISDEPNVIKLSNGVKLEGAGLDIRLIWTNSASSGSTNYPLDLSAYDSIIVETRGSGTPSATAYKSTILNFLKVIKTPFDVTKDNQRLIWVDWGGANYNQDHPSGLNNLFIQVTNTGLVLMSRTGTQVYITKVYGVMGVKL